MHLLVFRIICTFAGNDVSDRKKVLQSQKDNDILFLCGYIYLIVFRFQVEGLHLVRKFKKAPFVFPHRGQRFIHFAQDGGLKVASFSHNFGKGNT